MARRIQFGILLIFALALAGTAAGRVDQPHRFGKDQCSHCHPSAKENNAKAKQIPELSSEKCIACHRDVPGELSHPIAVIPNKRLPDDMPLADGRLSCLTCHYAHPSSRQPDTYRYALLRKAGRGSQFCINCHRISDNDHAVYENVHRVSHPPSDRWNALDAYTLQCVQCHDRHLRPWDSSKVRISGRRSSRLPGKHPVGAMFAEIASRNPQRFNHPALLDKKMRLFDGKIGCGTCHSAYSKEKHMLVDGNRKNALCLQCHIK